MCVHVVVVLGALKGVVTHEGIKGEADKGWWRVWFADWIEPSWDDEVEDALAAEGVGELVAEVED